MGTYQNNTNMIENETLIAIAIRNKLLYLELNLQNDCNYNHNDLKSN